MDQRVHRSRGHRSWVTGQKVTGQGVTDQGVTDQVAKVKGLKIFGGGTSTIILSISFPGYFH